MDSLYECLAVELLKLVSHVLPPAAAEHCHFTILAMVEGTSTMCTNSAACSRKSDTHRKGVTALQWNSVSIVNLRKEVTY